jgi:plasmid stabilization system protein ParE
MNPYTVEWLPQAEDELADIWLRAADRAAVTTAQAQVDRLLARDPQGNGRYLSEGLYQIDYSPLVVSYTIDDSGRRVEVTWVRPTIT